MCKMARCQWRRERRYVSPSSTVRLTSYVGELTTISSIPTTTPWPHTRAEGYQTVWHRNCNANVCLQRHKHQSQENNDIEKELTDSGWQKNVGTSSIGDRVTFCWGALDNVLCKTLLICWNQRKIAKRQHPGIENVLACLPRPRYQALLAHLHLGFRLITASAVVFTSLSELIAETDKSIYKRSQH